MHESGFLREQHHRGLTRPEITRSDRPDVDYVANSRRTLAKSRSFWQLNVEIERKIGNVQPRVYLQTAL